MPFLAGESMGRVWFCRKFLPIFVTSFWSKKVELAIIYLLEHFSKYISIPENTDGDILYISSSFWIWAHNQIQTMSGAPMKIFGQLLRVDIFKWLFFFVSIRKGFVKKFWFRAWESQSRKRSRKISKTIKLEIWKLNPYINIVNKH